MGAFAGMKKVVEVESMSHQVYQSWDPGYKSVFGAVEQETEIRFTIRIPENLGETYVGFVVCRDGGEDFYVQMFPENSSGGGDGRAYTAAYRFDQPGIYWYYFKLCTSKGDLFVKKDFGSTGTLCRGEEVSRFQQTVYEHGYTTPEHLKGGVFYQIFPDRFCYSGRRHPDVPGDRILRSDWGGQPFYQPDAQGRVLNNDYFCGDLEGIRQKLGYLKELGVTCLYLNPVFEAHSNHRYNVADYRRIDPLLGSNEEFKALCAEAKAMGIGVVLDGVFSHTGSDSVYFNKEGRYPSLGAYNSPDSPYYSWYKFTHYPDAYHSWWGFTTLPETDECNPGFYDFICGSQGVVEYWLGMGATGFRLDVADELPDKMLDGLRQAVKAHSKEAILIGEVWEDASNKESYGQRRRYLIGRQLDSVMNYPFRNAILDFARGGDVPCFVNRVMSIVENYPKPALDVLLNSLSTHDTARAITELAGESCEGHDRNWQSQRALTLDQYALGKQRLKLAMALQYLLPGLPCVYYGDEAGMQGYKDPFNRGCFPWGHEDQELLAFTKKLGSLRASRKCLQKGTLALSQEGALLKLVRQGDGDRLCAWFNNTDQVQESSEGPVEAWGFLLSKKTGNKAS